jgi:IS30 family transposase
LIIGTGRSAIGTLVERSSRSTLLVHLPRMEGWGEVTGHVARRVELIASRSW